MSNLAASTATAPVTRTYRKYKKSEVKTNPQQVASYTAKKRYSNHFSEMSTEADNLVDQLLNPEDCVDVTRWPNTYGLSSVYKCKTVFNARFDSTGRSCIAVAPTINDSIFATWGAVSTVPLNLFGTTNSNNPYSFQSIVLDQNLERVSWNAPIIFNNGHALTPFPNATHQRLIYPMGFNFTGIVSPEYVDVYMRVIFPNAVANQAGVRVVLYNSALGVVSSAFSTVQYHNTDTVSPPPFMGANILLGTNIQLAPVAYISIEIEGTALPYKGPVYMALGRTTGPSGSTSNIVLPNHAQHVGVYDIKDAGTIAESASQAFILAQSLLLTAEMSDINNGGMLSIARVPAGSPIGMDSTQNQSSINTNNWYEWLASLSNNNYDGPVKDGGYSWYLGEDETAYFYRPIDNYFSKELPYLASEFTVIPSLAESAVVRIKISSIVQFTTTASIYDQRPSCYLSDRDFMHHVLSLIPASYSNGRHKEALKKALFAAGGKVKALLKNPKTYTTAAKLLTLIAPLVV